MKRFDFESYQNESYMEESADGEYCLYDDCEAMEKRAIAAESKLAEIEAQEPVEWQYKSSFDEWKSFINEKHKIDTIADGGFEVRPLYALPVQSSLERKHQRITEQDARAIIKNYMELCIPFKVTFESWMSVEGEALLAKLNEHREPDYKTQADELLESLYAALPFVEDAEFNEGYKPKRVADIVKSIKAAIAKASESNAEGGQ